VRCIIDGQVVLSRPLEGPLAAQIAAFAKWAREQGYALRSRYQRVLLAAGFSRWLGEQAVGLHLVSSEHPARYLRFRARRVKVQPPCPPPADRGGLALSPSAQRRQLEAPPSGPARRGRGARRQGDAPAPPPLQPPGRQRQASLQGRRRRCPRARRLRLGRAAFEGSLERRLPTLSIVFSNQLWRSQSTDEGRHDPEDTRRSFATGRLSLPDSRHKTALPLDGERSCGSALRATRAYENDSSSKRPASSVVRDPQGGR